MEILDLMKSILTGTKTSNKRLGTYNPELDKYEDTVGFPEKVAKGREMLAKAGLPSELQNRQVKK